MSKNTTAWMVCYSEFTARFITWGIISQLLVHITTSNIMPVTKTLYFIGVIFSLLYLSALSGGFIKDFFLQEEYCISIGMFFLLLGNLFLTQNYLLLFGIVFIILGAGLITPNTPLLLQRYCNQHSSNKLFTTLYASSNAGAILGPIIFGFLALKTFWASGLIVNILFILLWFIKTLLMKTWIIDVKKYINIKLALSLVLGGLFAIFYIHFKLISEVSAMLIGILYIVLLLKVFSMVSKEKRKQLLFAIYFLFFAIIFFSGEFQVASTAAEYAKEHMNLSFFFLKIPVSALLSFESIFVVIGALFLPKLLFKLKSIMLKVCVGLFFGAIAFLILYISTYYSYPQVSLIWLIFAFMFLGFGEITLMPAIINYVSDVSPERFKGRLMAGVYLSLSLAGILSGVIANLIVNIKFGHLDNIAVFQKEFYVTGLLIGGSCLLLILSKYLFKKIT